MSNSSEAKWYILHTKTGYEKSAEESLHNLVVNNNLQDYIFDVVTPMIEDVVEKNGKRKVVQRIKYPTYIYIKMIYTDHVWWLVTSTKGVTGFTGPKGRPLCLLPEEVKRAGLEAITMDDFDIKVGDNVKVTSGALDTFIGVVEEINLEKQKVRVSVSMFGRSTPVELDFTQIEKL